MALEDLVLDVILEFIEDEVPFTALDVSNEVKKAMPFARHREVRDIVRSSFTSDIEPAGYARTPIKVTLVDGSTTEALLYHTLADSWDLDIKYVARNKSVGKAKTAPTASSVPAVSVAPVSTFIIPPPVVVVPPPPPPTSTKDLWNQLFQSKPSLFPLK